jgi:HTH-type transcriptional regulator, transcriptional repressor of NAD biosynthesis genes
MNAHKYGHALIVGKFYPPHKGHIHLIEMAARFSDYVTVVLLGASVESLTVQERVAWMRYDLSKWPGVRVVGILDDFPVDYSDSWVWECHIGLMREAIVHADLEKSFPPIDVVFSSENYGIEMGARLGVRAVVLDPERSALKISGSQVRADVTANWDWLPPGTRSGLCIRVVVLGAESTGTTTLCRDLSERLRAWGGIWERTIWVPEFGREYSAALVATHNQSYPTLMPENITWSEEDFFLIAREQTLREEMAARSGSPYLILDTDALATTVWHERYRGCVSRELVSMASALPRRELYVVTRPDGVEFEQDGLRDGEHLRSSMTDRFREVVCASGVPWLEVSGTREERVIKVLDRLDEISRIRWSFNPPLIERNKP